MKKCVHCLETDARPRSRYCSKKCCSAYSSRSSYLLKTNFYNMHNVLSRTCEQCPNPLGRNPRQRWCSPECRYNHNFYKTETPDAEEQKHTFTPGKTYTRIKVYIGVLSPEQQLKLESPYVVCQNATQAKLRIRRLEDDIRRATKAGNEEPLKRWLAALKG